MKNGLLVCSGTGEYKNIGDYMQSLASAIFFDKFDVFVEREALNVYKSDEKTRVIMNAWYMHKPENFPPSDDIVPLPISMHIKPNIAEKMLSPKSVEWFKKYAPIGVRDTGTKEILEKYGIPCYFSGCLTLALGERYLSKEKSGEIIFVDPYYEWHRQYSTGRRQSNLLIKSLITIFKHPATIIKLYRKIQYESDFLYATKFRTIRSLFEKIFRTAAFYRTYSTMFSDDFLTDAVFIIHNVTQQKFKGDREKLDYAEELLKRYARAKLVVTSRIHCALPCLGVETPVIFVTSDNLESTSSIRSAGRFGGLIELFRVARYRDSKLTTDDEYLKKFTKITPATNIENKPDYLKLKQLLISKCREFIANSK
jgi:hypothetical protein